MEGKRKYMTTVKPIIMFKCHTNNLNLGDRKRFKNEPTTCLMCGAVKEDLNHFLLQCDACREEQEKFNVATTL